VARFRSLFASALLILPAACGGSGAGPVDISVIGAEPVLNAPAPLHVAGYGAMAATRSGLIGFDAEGRLIPALAERWVVTDDAQAYIFRLRDGLWADGTPIAAADVAAALHRAVVLAGAHGSTMRSELAGIRDIRVMARRVIEIDLDSPQPDFLTLLAQPELAVAAGARGTHHTGPMTIRRDGDHWIATLVPADRANHTLALRFQSAQDAVDRFAAGKADLVLGGTFATMPLATRIAMARGNLQFDPVAGIFGLDVVTATGFLADPANREAVAMAIDRDALASAFGVGGWAATTRIVSAGLDGDNGTMGERWTGQTIDQRRQVAIARVKAAKTAPVLTVSLPVGPGADILFGRLHDDLAGVGITLVRVAPGATADLALIDSVARYPRARWFLEQLGCAVHVQVCSPQGDASLMAAIHASDTGEAARLFAQAESEITAANGFIPLSRPLRWSLVHGTVSGFSPNPWGWHPLPPLAAAGAN
jgi:peptide/nickel transport system substrate-binding protein/oligopeptide transport system substrate-binding protein